MPQLLYPQEKNPPYPLDRRLGGPQSQSGDGGKEKNHMIAPPRNQTPVVQSLY